ncbi:cholinesterase 1-like [Mercenaria mercenaria]|uniref:cholinesterase 1-like n=1 Tax=Mercenaria mercenaria TaxID=6596 RepID=UPI00234F43FB|nr:cholinesterase 1-like [Mercenaria mercenaria]XP_045169238.2 cholinesterase 1-like [Mercenaria mercenaria]
MRFTLGILVILSVAVGKLFAQETKAVTTTIGVVKGKTEIVSSFEKTGKLHKFLGIPFAEPPVGELRFKKPVPKTPLSAPLDAFTHNNACMQDLKRPNISYSEDCLYLNIYAPERENENDKLPVMIWIYGGGFHYGDSNMYSGDYLSIHGDVIVVTLNYRVSIFGFLSTGDISSPGNYGLWDQRLAIEWVNDNIAAFGGDVEKITIFGESAGSSSVIYQGLYTGNRGLFQRIIAQSGSIMAWWASTDKGLRYANTVGSIANCEMETTDDLVSCLRNLPADKLLDIIMNAPVDDDFAYYPFRPTFDNDFIKYDPKKVFDSTNSLSRDVVQFFADFDLLTGVNIIEGVGGLSPMFGVQDLMNFAPNRTDFENRLVPILIKEKYGEGVPSVLSKIVSVEYTNWTDPNNFYNVRDEYLRMHGDAYFNADMYKTVDTHVDQASAKTTYIYMLDTEPETRIGYYIPWIKKAMHGDELPIVFGYRITYGEPFPTPKEWEIKLSTQVMTLWANFAKSGNPNVPDVLGINWSPYTALDQHYLHITRNMTSENVRQRWNIGAANFWLDIVPPIAQLTSCETDYHGGINSAAFISLSLLIPFLSTIVTIFVSDY